MNLVPSYVHAPGTMDHGYLADPAAITSSHQLFHNQNLTVSELGSQQASVMSSSDQKGHSGSNTEGTDMAITEEALSNGTCDLETVIDSHSVSSSGDVLGIGDLLALSNDGISEISNSDLSLPEVCISTNSTSFEEDMNYEVQQAYRIFTGFLLDKHKAITSSFLNPIGHLEAQHGIGGVRGRGQAQLKQSMCLRRMEEKFVGCEYETITEFVADFRLMLENCYRYHGVDHWISKQAQKLEIMLEQKLTLLSRTLREKTTLAVTSTGRFGAEEERSSGGTSTRRRSAPRSLATLTVGGHESIMVQALRLEEQQRAKEEKRQRELDKKEAEEMSAKEVEEWERNLLSQASPHTLETLWELPAIGHLLCLAQTALNLPEIVFFELERCLLMPRCSPFLSKIMSALLCPPQRRATLHRRPALPYRRWESELRQRVQGWYRTVGVSHDQPARAEQLGLCHQFFSTLGEVNPLEETPFHLLPFYQRVWLLKGLCDNVYETQKDVQGAVLAQPIHECRESILGYDSMDNAYIHFPHFCGADLRIYCQSPSMPPKFPLPPVWVKRIEPELGTEATEDEGSDGMKPKKIKRKCYGISTEMGESDDCGNEGEEKRTDFKRENGGTELNSERFNSWPLKDEEGSDTETSDEDDSSEDSKSNFKTHNNSLFSPTHLENSNRGKSLNFKEESHEFQPSTLTVKQELSFSLDSGRTIKAETWEPCLSVGEHSYTGRSPARSENLVSPGKVTEVKMGGDSPNQEHRVSSCSECSRRNTALKSEEHVCCCSASILPPRPSCESTQNSSDEKANDRMRSRKKKRKKGRGREQLLRVKGGNRQLQQPDGARQCQAQAAKSSRSASTIKRKDERKKPKTGKKVESSKKVKEESPVEPSFKLVCTSLEELRRLISKTEDELDSLESTKKRAGRWYLNKESVKELHITLIRLLNELSPWEPKLVKAYHRNRLRLKKEFDDFRKHPDYNNFVREECASSSSEEDEDNSVGGEVCSLPDHYRGAEEDDHGVPRSLWTGGALKQFEGQSNDSLMTTVNHLKRSFSSTDEDLTLRQRNHTSMTTLPHSALEPRSGLNRTDQARDGYSTLAAASTTQASLGSRSIILHPTIGLPKGYTPIPTLLAKSVGNKVTLMKRPADYLGVSSNVGQSKMQVMTQPSPVVAASECTRAQGSQSQPEQSFQQLHSQGPQKTQLHKRIIATATTALPKSLQGKPSHATLPKSPVQVVCKAPDGLGHLLKKDDNSQVKISVQSIMDQNTGEKRMQQVVILPSNLLIQKTEEASSSQQLHKNTQAPFSKVAGPLCMTTNVPGFTIPDSRIPVQQVAPLKDARAVRNPSPSVSPHLQQNPLTASLKLAQASSTQANAPQTIVQNWSLATSPTSAVSTESTRPTDPKQELKTVCIRDSQSILVTTRGGNTGIVKVQTSSDQNAPGSLPPSPIITISPQFKAFLVSQTSPPCSLSAPSQTSSCTFPAGMKLSEVQPQQQVHSVKSSSTVTAPRPALVTGTIPLVGLRSQTSGSTVTFCHGDNLSPGPMVVSQSGQKAETTTSGSQFPAPLVKNTVIVPSLSGSGNPPLVKCASTDERSQLTKLILVAPSSSSSSSSSSNAALHKVTSSSTTLLPCSRFVFISQSAGATTTTTTSMGSIAKQGLVAGTGGQPLTTSIPSEPVKMGISLAQPVSSNHTEVQSITLPTGVQIRMPGRTVSLGQAGGALPQSTKSTAVSISMTGSQAATTGMALAQSPMVTSTSNSSHVQGASSFATVPQPSPPRSMAAVVTPPPGCVIKQDPSLSKGVFATTPSAQVTTTAQMNPAKTTMPTLVHQSKNVLNVPTQATPSIVPHTPASTLKRASTTGSTNPFSTSTIPSTTTAASTMQQRIVINTTTPLAAGTQILLNNTRFVVPPQGLGPGSHVLLISSPVTPPVPITSTATTPVKALLQGPSPMTDASRRPVIPASPPARLPNTPALGSSGVAGAPATGPTVLITAPAVTPLRLAGTPALSSPFRGATNVVSALPRLPAPQGMASPVSGTPTLVSALPLLASASALISPVRTSVPDLTSVLPAVQLPAGTSTVAQCSPHTSTLSPALAVLPRLTAPPLCSPILPTTSAVASISPGMSTLAPLSSAELAGLPPAPATQQKVSVGTPSPGFPHQLKTLTLPASSTVTNVIQQASLHTGPTNTSINHQVATVMQPILACTRTQLLPTVAVPPIASTASRMQSLPIATVTPIGSTLSSLQASPVAIVPPSNTTVLLTPAQPNRELKTHETVCTPIFLTNKALGKPALQNSASAVHATIGSKLLISPDGAVLNTVQGPVNPASLPVISPKPLATLVVSASSASGRALPTTCTNNSTVQAAEGDISEPMN